MKNSKIAKEIAEAEALEPPYSPEDLKLIRKSFDFSQSEFARLLRVEKSWVTKREHGTNRMTASDTSLYQALLHMRKHNCGLEWLADC